MDNSSFEISPNWDDKYERKVPTREELYKEEVISCMNYLKLRKINGLSPKISGIWKKLRYGRTDDRKSHQHLKQLEMQLVSRIGTVIVK